MLKFRKSTARSHGIKKNGNFNRKSRVQKSANCIVRYLDGKLDVHGRHSMLSFLSSLPISVLSIFDIEVHPVIDSKINHVRHFNKIPFINKGMDFIDLPSTFRDKSVQLAVPNYFKNCEVLIICYKYNKPIRSAIFHFNKVVSDRDIETCTSES